MNDLQQLRITSDARSVAAGNGRSRRKLVVGIAFAVTVLVGMFLLLSAGARKVTVYEVPADAGLSAGMLSATGYIVAKNPISITPEVSGRVISVGPDVGKSVAAGDILLEIDSSTYQSEFGATEARYAELAAGSRPEEKLRARALLDEAAALHKKASDDFARAGRLLDSGAISREEFDRFRRDNDAARFRRDAAENEWRLVAQGPRREQIQQARHQASGARVALERTVIRSPIDGIVVNKEVTPGEYVIAGQGVGLRDAVTPPPYVIADMSEMEAVVEISERDIARVSVGMPAVARPDALPDAAFAGVVDRITPFAYRQKGTIELRVKLLELSPLLKHDMNARIEFGDGAPTKKERIRIPAGALRSDDKGSFVLLLEESGVVRRDITSAPLSREEVIVETGLSGGERVILDQDVKAGDKAVL